MSRPRVGSLFAGYGGLDLAVEEVFGAELAWYSEVDKGALKILGHRFPGIANVGDVTKVDWSSVEPVEILTGGFPCIDISSNGKKAGIDEGEFSGLWRHMARAVGELRPGIIVVENVRDIVARGLGRVLGDLAGLGYDAQWTCVPACAVGAPFRRSRLFLLATPAGADQQGLSWLPEPDRSTTSGVIEAEPWPDDYRLALGEDRLLDRWARVVGRSAPNPVDWGVNDQPRVTAPFQEWLMGLPDGWVTDVPGITRNESLKALGNGVVPAQAAAALRLMLSRMEMAA